LAEIKGLILDPGKDGRSAMHRIMKELSHRSNVVLIHQIKHSKRWRNTLARVVKFIFHDHTQTETEIQTDRSDRLRIKALKRVYMMMMIVYANVYRTGVL